MQNILKAGVINLDVFFVLESDFTALKYIP